MRSIQRLPLPKGASAERVGIEYFRWLPRFLAPFVRLHVRGERFWAFRLALLPIDLLRLEFAPERSTPDRVLYRIRGGALVSEECSASARLEFRQVLGGEAVLAAIHDFRPRLPWLVYKGTQAIVHLLVMRAFGRHLARGLTATSAPADRVSVL